MTSRPQNGGLRRWSRIYEPATRSSPAGAQILDFETCEGCNCCLSGGAFPKEPSSGRLHPENGGMCGLRARHRERFLAVEACMGEAMESVEVHFSEHNMIADRLAIYRR